MRNRRPPGVAPAPRAGEEDLGGILCAATSASSVRSEMGVEDQELPSIGVMRFASVGAVRDQHEDHLHGGAGIRHQGAVRAPTARLLAVVNGKSCSLEVNQSCSSKSRSK